LDGRCPVDPLVVRRFAPRNQWMPIRRPVAAGAKRPRQRRGNRGDAARQPGRAADDELRRSRGLAALPWRLRLTEELGVTACMRSAVRLLQQKCPPLLLGSAQSQTLQVAPRLANRRDSSTQYAGVEESMLQ